MNLVKMNQNGQVSIPAKIRKALGLRPGDLVKVDRKEDGRIVLTPVGLAEKVEHPLKKYEVMGVDLGLLEATLAKTPTERAQTNYEMLRFKEEARKARERIDHADPSRR